MSINQQSTESVLAMPGNQRYEHFVKHVASTKLVWGLYQDGWGMAATEDGQQLFPIWPTEQTAQLCAKDAWQGFSPASFTLDSFMQQLLPNLQRDGVLPSVFFTATEHGVTPDVPTLLGNLEGELSKL